MKIIGATIIILALMTVWIGMHESTHAVIFWEYGCENVTFAILPNEWALVTTNAQCNKLTDEQRISLDHAQAMNEIIGYNISSMLVLIMGLIIFNRMNAQNEN